MNLHFLAFQAELLHPGIIRQKARDIFQYCHYWRGLTLLVEEVIVFGHHRFELTAQVLRCFCMLAGIIQQRLQSQCSFTFLPDG